MTDFSDLMKIFSVPRPSNSAGERRTREALCAWLDQHGIPYRTEHFRLFPYSNELIGFWLLGSSLLLLLTVAFRLPWPALLAVAVAMTLVIANVVTGRPFVVWMIPARGENILVSFGPAEPTRELVIATHYNSKTELFDHTIQGRLFRRLPLCIGLAALVIVLGALDRLFFVAGSSWSAAVQVVSILLALPVLVVVGAVGVNLLPGRLIEQSQGAVDNGAACAIVLALAARLSQAQLSQTRVTLAFFGGEEVSMQGSLAYVRGRAWPLPTAAINLELMGQRGPFVIWQREGNVLTSVPTDPALNQQVAAVVAEVTGGAPALVGGINSDGYSFIRNGIPACVLGSYDPQQGGGGLHRPTDSLERVALERLPVAVAILERLAGQYERRCEISSTVH
jgi:hypothetical protein